MEISPCHNSVAGHQIATNFCTCHDSTAVVPCTKFCSDHCIRIEVRVKRNFHRIWIAMEKPSVKRAPAWLRMACVECVVLSTYWPIALSSCTCYKWLYTDQIIVTRGHLCLWAHVNHIFRSLWCATIMGHLGDPSVPTYGFTFNETSLTVKNWYESSHTGYSWNRAHVTWTMRQKARSAQIPRTHGSTSISYPSRTFVSDRCLIDVDEVCCPGDFQGLYSQKGQTSYRRISWSLEATQLDVIMFVSLWNLTGIAAVLLPRCLSIFRAIGKV